MCPASSIFGKQDDDEFGTNVDETNKQFKLGKKLLKVQQRELLISNRRTNFTTLLLSQHFSSLSTTTITLLKKNSQKFRRISPPIYEQFRSLSTLIARLDMEWNDDMTIIIETIKQFRELLARKLLATSQIDGPIDRVIQSGAVEYIVQYLDLDQIHKYFNVKQDLENYSNHDSQYLTQFDPRKKTISVSELHQLQYEVSWAISNIASGTSEHTKYIVDLGCIPKLIELVHVENDNLKEQCLWALGNISGDSAIMRDLVLDHGLMPILLQILENTTDENVKRTTTWTVENLLRGNPPPSWEIASTAFPVLKNLICKSSDEQILIHSCWAMAYISQNGPIEIIIEHEDLVRKLNELLNDDNPAIQNPALRSICNLVTGDDYQTSFILKFGILENLKLNKIINHPKIDIRRDTLWTLSNITAGTAEQIQMVIDAGIITKIISLLLSGSEPVDVAKEGYWTLSNLCSGGNNDQIKYAIDQGIIRVFCKGLLLGDEQIIKFILEGMQNVINSALDLNVFDNVIHEINEYGGAESISTLKNHHDNAIRDLSSQIFDYFEEDKVDYSSPCSLDDLELSH